MPGSWRVAPALLHPVPRPPRIACEPVDGGIEIRRRRSLGALFYLVLCCIAVGTLTVFWLRGELVSSPIDWNRVLLRSCDLALVLTLASLTLALCLNTTVVRIGRSELSVRHGPLWWPGSRSIDTRRIRQLFCEARVQGGRNSTVCHSLCAVLDDGSTQELLGTGNDAEEVQYLEQEIERALGLKERVGGELRRD